jgi:ribosomal protein L10
MKKLLNKKYKKKQLQKIKQYYKNIYIFHYNNLSNNEIILIKKKLKNLNLNILILKKTIINNFLINSKLQGCLFILYKNNYLNLLNIFLIFKKLKLLLFINNNNFYSNLKLKKYLINLNNYFYIILLNSLIFFLKILKNLK